MKGAKELADIVRERMEHDGGYVPVFTEDAVDILAHLDAKAAIDSAVTGEVGEIAKRCADVEVASIETEEQDKAFERSKFLAPKDRATLLAIVQRQAGEMAALLRRPAESRALRAEIERDQARAEVERLKLEVAALKAERDHLATTRMESSAEIDRLQTERIALAQENAVLINDVGNLDATAREQRQRAEVLARGVAAYRTGSFTLAQVWENEEGKAVR